MVIAHASANREPRWLLTLRGATSLDDDLGMLGTWVGPRTGPDSRTHGQKEDYVARRILVAWRECGLLQFPVEVQAETETEGEPDFVLAWSGGDSLGLEVTEAGEEIYQKWLTFTERSEATDSIPLGASTPPMAAEIKGAIRRKVKRYDEGAYRGPDACDLVVYDNTAWSGLLDVRDVIARLGGANDLMGRFRQVHLVSGEVVFVDVLGEGRRVEVRQTYEIDFAAWVHEQVERLRRGATDEVDIEHIAEELEQLARSERRALASHLHNLMLHLLKWQFQPSHRGDSWSASIDNARSHIHELLTEMPSLRQYVEGQIEHQHDRARKSAAAQTGLPKARFPEDCPYAAEQLLDPEFLPSAKGDDDG